MKSTEQARGEIVLAIDAWRRERRREDGQMASLSDLADESGCSVSMLYQFMRDGGPLLGTASVNKLRPLLDKHLADHSETWLAAMGVSAAAGPTP